MVNIFSNYITSIDLAAELLLSGHSLGAGVAGLLALVSDQF